MGTLTNADDRGFLDLAEFRARMEPVYLRVAEDLRAIQHPSVADMIDRERELLWGRPGAAKPAGLLHMVVFGGPSLALRAERGTETTMGDDRCRFFVCFIHPTTSRPAPMMDEDDILSLFDSREVAESAAAKHPAGAAWGYKIFDWPY